MGWASGIISESHGTVMANKYGAGMADSNLHAPGNLPVLLLGGGVGRDAAGKHLKFPSNTPLANLHLTLLDRMGVPTVEKIGDSTGRLERLSLM